MASCRLADIDDDHQPAAALFLDIIVRRVMRNVAVNQPLAGPLCLPDDVITLPRPNIDRIGQEARRRGKCLAVTGDDLEGSAMDMHRMDKAIVGADETHFQRLAELHMDRIG